MVNSTTANWNRVFFRCYIIPSSDFQLVFFCFLLWLLPPFSSKKNNTTLIWNHVTSVFRGGSFHPLATYLFLSQSDLLFPVLEYINKKPRSIKLSAWASLQDTPSERPCGLLLLADGERVQMFTCARKTGREVPRNRASLVFSLSGGSMHLHWYEPELPIDPLCLVFVLGHYGDERVTFSRGVSVERRLFNSVWKNEGCAGSEVYSPLRL